MDRRSRRFLTWWLVLLLATWGVQAPTPVAQEPSTAQPAYPAVVAAATGQAASTTPGGTLVVAHPNDPGHFNAGARDTRIVLRHVLPGALPPVITQAALHVGGAILVEAGLSFLGVGDRHVVSWGALLNDAQQFVRQAWWMSAFPGLALTLTVLGSNLVADGLNDAWDPRLS